MLLQRLKEYADERMELPPALYTLTPIRYVIEIDEQGKVLSPRPTVLGDSTPQGKRGLRLLAPEVVRAAGIRPLLLADISEYVLGLARDEAKQSRVDACHRAFRDLLDRCLAATNDPLVAAVARFYELGGLHQLELEEDFDRGAKVTFRVHAAGAARYAFDSGAVEQFWAADNDPGARGAVQLQCLICGERRPALKRLQGKIKGVMGGQSSGTSIISANADAFESYGLSASLTSPTCADCAERFTRAANELLGNRATRLYVSGTSFIFWTVQEVDFSWATILSEPTPEDVTALLDAIRRGRIPPELESTAFYAASLAPSGGRAAVRDWIDTTVAEAQRSLARWFELQRVVGAFGEDPSPLGLYALSLATVREANDLPVTIPRALLRAALARTPVPAALLAAALRRNHSEQRITRARAALIKLALLSRSGSPEEDYLVDLETTHPNPAYHCGRLLAVLESVQRAALPGVNATIIDRFFGTASTSPGLVFPRLLRGAQPHLSRLERDRRGAYHALQRQLEETLAHVQTFPNALSLEDQGLFSLGYYHQRAKDRAQMNTRHRDEANPTDPDSATLREE